MPKLTKTHDRGPRDWYQLECWRKQRRYQLQLEPLCQQCLKERRVTPATQVDHIRPHRGDWNEFRTGALQSLCADCHVRKTNAEMGNRIRRIIGLDGMPIEPNLLPVHEEHEDDDDDEDVESNELYQQNQRGRG
jgi:5-methylcytosine-specific restriction enzyme A